MFTAEPGVIGGMPASGLEFRRGDQHASHHRPALPVRLLRRRRARRRLPRARPGRPARQRQRQQVRAEARGRRRLHQHQPERQEGRLRRHVRRRRPEGRDRRRHGSSIAQEGDASRSSSPRSSTSPSAAPRGRRGQRVLYVTERCVFALRPHGLELVEVAPGIDIERDILARMDFRPLIRARSDDDGRTDFQTRADGTARRPRRACRWRALHLRPDSEHSLRQFRALRPQ